MNEDAFADRDAYGLTADDWASFLGYGPEYYTGPALLFWALADCTMDEGPYVVTSNPFVDLLRSLVDDAHALSALATNSQSDDVQDIAPALKNLYRRIAAAAEIADRLEGDPSGGHGPRTAAPPPPALPSPKVPARRRKG